MPLPPPPPPVDRPPAAASPVRWRDQGGLTVALTIVFGVMVLACALLTAALANRLSVVHDLRAGHYANILQRAEDADDVVDAASFVFVATQLVVAVLFVIWMYRTAKNNEALGRVGARFGPGWSVGAWFIPIANLVIPLLIVEDLWRGSDAATPRDDSEWRRVRGSPLVGCWWAALLVSLVRFAVPGSQLHEPGTLDEIERSNIVGLVGVVVLAVAAVLGLFVVRSLARRQLDALRAQHTNDELDAAAPR